MEIYLKKKHFYKDGEVRDYALPWSCPIHTLISEHIQGEIRVGTDDVVKHNPYKKVAVFTPEFLYKDYYDIVGKLNQKGDEDVLFTTELTML